MYVDQISVFIENTPGSAAQVTQILDDAHLNIRALSLCDTSAYGVLRMILDEPDRAFEELKKAQLTIKSTPVLAVRLTDSAGGLNRVLQIVGMAGASVEYAYAFITRHSGTAVAILRVEGDDAKVAEMLQNEGIALWNQEEMLENLTPTEFYD